MINHLHYLVPVFLRTFFFTIFTNSFFFVFSFFYCIIGLVVYIISCQCFLPTFFSVGQVLFYWIKGIVFWIGSFSKEHHLKQVMM